MALPSSHPFASRLSFFTGKGGVGKSTVVAALALQAADRGMRPLIVELGHRASMQALFDVPIQHAPTEVAPGVFATNIDLDQALADYVRRNVPVEALAKRVTRSDSLRRFFSTAPAVGEVLTLLRLEQLWAREWNPILVDLDATGHALMFLGLPRVFDGLVPDGPVRRLLDSFSALLRDGARSQLHLVTLPAQLPVQETLELHRQLRDEHAIRLGTLFVNRVPEAQLAPEHHDALTDASAVGAAVEDLELLRAAVRRTTESHAQLARLDAIAMRRVLLPFRTNGCVGQELAELGALAAEESP